MGGAGVFRKFLNIWLNKVTDKFNDYSTHVASHTSLTLPSTKNIAKLDSGASQHFIKSTQKDLLANIKKLNNGPTIKLPNDDFLQVSHEGNIKLQNLPLAATKAYILPNLTNESLLSVGQLCDHNCTVEFNNFFCDIKHKNKLILQGLRNFKDGLYDIDMNQPVSVQSTINYVVHLDKTKLEMAKYLHAALFSPCMKTLQQAIYNGNLLSWPIENLNFEKIL